MQQQQQQQQLAAGRQAGPGSSVTGDTAERNRIFAREAFDLGMEIIKHAPIKIRTTLSQLVLMKYNVCGEEGWRRECPCNYNPGNV